MANNDFDVLTHDELELANWIEKNFLDGMNKTQICSYFMDLQNKVEKINIALRESSLAISTGVISKNPQLHGFLFEKIHVYTFNVKAALAHKNFRAFVLPIDGGGFGKNSVDIVIKNTKTGKILKKYQAKCCATAEATIQAFLHGNYRNQRYLVAKGQVDDVKKACSASKSVTDSIAYGGISSTPQQYSKVKEIQNALQSGDFSKIDLSMFTNKELILVGVQHVGKTVAVDAIFRTLLIAFDQVVLGSNKNVKDEIKENVAEVAWDAPKLGCTDAVSMAFAKNVEKLPELLQKIPKDQITPVSYELCSVVIDVIRVGLMYSNGECSEIEAYSKVIQSVIKTACAITGGAIAGALSEGSLSVVGSIVGRICGEVIVAKIGDENFIKAAKGIKALKDNVVEYITCGTEKLEQLVNSLPELELEGI